MAGWRKPTLCSLQSSGEREGKGAKQKKSCGFRGFEAHGAQTNTMLLLVQLFVDFQFAAFLSTLLSSIIKESSIIKDWKRRRFFIFLSRNMYAFHRKHRDLRVPLPFSQGNGRGEGLSPAIASPISLAVVVARPGRATRSPPAPLRPDPPRSPPSRARRAPPGAVFRPLFATSAARGLGVSRAEWARRSLRAAPAASSRSVGRVESPEARRSRSGDVEGVEARRRTARDQGWYPSA